MSIKSIFIRLIIPGSVFLSILCTSPMEMAGNSSQTPNAIFGTIYEPDGITPAKAVRVHIRPKNSLAGLFGIAAPQSSKDTASAVTNDLGQFVFDTSLTTGIYVIEAKSGNNAVFIDSIPLITKRITDTLPPETLKPAGAIKGIVKLKMDGDLTKVYVLAFGIDRFAIAKTDGSFIFPALAEGKYDLRLISSLQNYGILDMRDVKVTSSDTLNLGTLELPYNGIPVPLIVNYSIDSINPMPPLQTITIRWNKTDDAIKSYNCYSSISSYGSTENEMHTVTDTFLIDTTFKGYEITEYRVAGVDKQNREGPKSEALYIKVGIGKAVEAEKRIGQLFGTISMAIDAQNNFWIADYDHHRMFKYSPSCVLMTDWEMEAGDSSGVFFKGFYPSAMDLDLEKNIYIKDRLSKRILKYDSSGNLVKKTIDTTGITLLDISVDQDGYIYSNFLKNTDTYQYVNKYNPDLTLNKSWETSFDGSLHHGLLAKNGKVYCSGSFPSYSSSSPNRRYQSIGPGIELFNSEGDKLKEIHVAADEIAIDKNGLIYGVDAANNMVWIVDSTSERRGNFEITSGSLSMSDNLYGIEILDDGTIAIGLGHPASNSCAIHFFRRP